MSDGQVEYRVVVNDEGVEQSLDNTNKKVEGKASKFVDTAGKIGGAVGKAALAVSGAAVAAGGAAITFGSAFESSMAAASTLFGDAQVNADELNKKMLELSDGTGIAADQLGSSLYNALSAGIPATDDMSEALDFLDKSAQLAKAGFTDIDTAMSATVKTLNAYGMGVEETDRIQKILMQTQNMGIVTVDELGSVLSQVTPTASAMGVSFEQVGAGLAVMTANGTPAAQATTQLNGLFAELGKSGTIASVNLEKAAEGTKYAGKSFQDLMAEGVPLNEVLDLIGNYADESGLSMLDMFSSIDAGKAALSISGQNTEKFTNALSAMGTETDVVGEAFDKVTGTTSEKFNKILNELKNTAIDLFLQMQPLITEALPVLQSLIEQLAPPLMQLASDLLPVLGEMFTGLLPPLIELIDEVMPVLVQLFNDFLPPLIDLVQMLMPVVIELFKTLLPPIAELIQDLMPVMLELFEALMPLLEVLIKLLGPILDLFLALIKPILDLISGALEPLIEIIGVLMEIALQPLIDYINTLAFVWGSVFKLISDMISNYVQTWVTVFTNWIDFFKNIFTGNWQAALDNLRAIFDATMEGIKNAFKLPINFIIDGLNKFIEGINKIKIPDWVPVVGGKGFSLPKIPRLKVGMDYVPSDWFPAYLDKGEAVLPADQAAIYRALGGDLTKLAAGYPMGSQSFDIDYDKLAGAMSKYNMYVQYDRRTIGRIWQVKDD